jgi:hypothetical protein
MIIIHGLFLVLIYFVVLVLVFLFFLDEWVVSGCFYR